jgi:hypothetical protein
MNLNPQLAHWICDHHANPFVVGLLTFSFPRAFLSSYYANNRGRVTSWNGRRACLSLSFDCDYPRDAEAMPAVLRQLARHPFKTSFACVGHWIERYPREHALVLEHGHEIMNHTYSHPDNELLSPGRKFREITRAEKKEEVERCHDICRRVLRYEPAGCRIPHFKNLFTPEIYGILRELGYAYSSSTLTMNTKTFGLPFAAPEGITEFPLSTCPRHPFTVFDTWHSFNSPRLAYRLVHRSEEGFLEAFAFLLDTGIRTNSYLNVYLDPYDASRPYFGRMLELLEERSGELWIAPYETVARALRDGSITLNKEKTE